MPLEHGKSKKAFEHNVKAELHAGKPLAQSLAIAYATKKRAKKMAHGGEVGVHSPQKAHHFSGGGKVYPTNNGHIDHEKEGLVPYNKDELASYRYSMSEGVHKYPNPKISEHKNVLGEQAVMKSKNKFPKHFAEGGDVVDRIMAKKYSEGGVVANNDSPEADEEPAMFDDLVLDDHLHADYPGSNEIGDEEVEHEDEDMIARIMRSRAKKDKMPRVP